MNKLNPLKTCCMCGVQKSFIEFTMLKNKKGVHFPSEYCKPCIRERHRLYRMRNPEKYAKQKKDIAEKLRQTNIKIKINKCIEFLKKIGYTITPNLS